MAILPNGSSSIGQIDLAKKQRPLRGEVGQYGVYDAYFHGGLNETYPRPCQTSAAGDITILV